MAGLPANIPAESHLVTQVSPDHGRTTLITASPVGYGTPRLSSLVA